MGRGVMLNSYSHLGPRLIAAIPLQLYMPSWHAKEKFILERTTKAQRSSRDIAVLFL